MTDAPEARPRKRRPRLNNAPSFEIWQVVSYGFLHGSFTHLLFNMFALYMFGGEVEQLLGSRRFLTYYMVCVIGAAVAQLIVMGNMNLPPVPTVGASGGVFGLLLAFGMAWPQRRLMLLFPPIPMPAWLFVTLYGLLELYLGITGSGFGVAHFAHLVAWLPATCCWCTGPASAAGSREPPA